ALGRLRKCDSLCCTFDADAKNFGGARESATQRCVVSITTSSRCAACATVAKTTVSFVLRLVGRSFGARCRGSPGGTRKPAEPAHGANHVLQDDSSSAQRAGGHLSQWPARPSLWSRQAHPVRSWPYGAAV